MARCTARSNRLIRRTAHGPTGVSVFPKAAVRGAAVPALRPAQSRIDEALYPERRQQRAEAIGSVLLSFATAAIFSIAGLMVLAELGIQLAPLLASAGIAGLAHRLRRPDAGQGPARRPVHAAGRPVRRR